MSEQNISLRHAVIAALTLSAAASALPAAAQTPEPAADARTIESIVVTAQKREQSLQDVPIVVTAVSEQLLKDTGVKDIKDLTILTPGSAGHIDIQRISHYCAHSRHRYGRRQSRSGIFRRHRD